ncbi:hypothetical protein A2771_03450 [Candidatus Woesebacteria bacterium RIFCSPHIGHO2_01_FULL_38_26b]|uniref:Nitroreductase domain-containing protein n=1 Tax=Candidatus Woesebacteria bacterium RIFCSPHIGHO2_01_FULL_38_26b TaxID=1802491 RepID=A0A1F7XYY0_9BACT|nr:MAG: hypothetical protein A2771_03450 [Candidatus Woesebacteria bacterium RIFCSPHIGHO2_01_FULL_38_26b]
MSNEIFKGIRENLIWPKTKELDIYHNRKNFAAWEITPLKNFQNKKFREIAEYFVSWGILAPSAHNKQPWIVDLDENEKNLTVYPDPKALGTSSDKYGRQANVGIGCFTANLSLALNAYGLTPIYSLQTNGRHKTSKVQFDLGNIHSGYLVNTKILELIKVRRAYRGPFVEGYEIDEYLLEQFKTIASNEGVMLKIIQDQGRKNKIGKAQALADMAVLKIPAFRNELAGHLVTNDTNETRVMPGNTFGLNDEEAQEVHDALISSKQMPGHFAAGFPRSDQEGVIKSSVAFTILAHNQNENSFIRSGIALEKIWLMCQANGLGVRIMAGMIESPLHNLALKTILNEMSKYPAVFACIGLPEKDSWPKSPREQIKF